MQIDENNNAINKIMSIVHQQTKYATNSQRLIITCWLIYVWDIFLQKKTYTERNISFPCICY